MLLALRSLWQPKIIVLGTLANLQLVATPAGAAAVEVGPQVPAAVVAIVPTVLRPAAPSLHGDQDLLTLEQFFDDSLTPTGTAAVVATGAVDDAPSGSVGSISHLVFRAACYRTDTDTYDYDVFSNYRMTWRVGANSGAGAITNPAAPAAPSTPIIRFGAPPYDEPNDPVPPSVYVETGAIATQPNGLPWTWAAVNALEDLAVRYDWAVQNFGVDGDHPSYVNLVVAEMWVEVFGVGGGHVPKRSLRFKLQQGAERFQCQAGVARTKLAMPARRITIPM